MKKITAFDVGGWLSILFWSAIVIGNFVVLITDPQEYLDYIVYIATHTCWMGYGTPPNCIGF